MSDLTGTGEQAVARARVAAEGVTWAPPVSVIMPVRDEERHLAEAVTAILRQDYPGGLELVLAVGPSRDRTAEIAGGLAEADGRITVLDNPTGKIPSALNLAVKAARHPVIIRVDGHAVLPGGYIATAVAALAQTGAANTGGIMAAEGVTPFERAVAWAMTSRFGVGSAPNHTGGAAGPTETVYLGAFRREAIERAGGYDEDYLVAEDWELNHRIRREGGLVWFTPELRVTYRPRANVAALASQYFRYGRWRRVVARQHRGTINVRYLAPPAAAAAIGIGLAAGLAGLGIAVAGSWGAGMAVLLAGFAIPAAYLLGVLGVTALAARTLRGRALAALPVALVTMHLCWGVGFLTSPARLVPDRLARASSGRVRLGGHRRPRRHERLRHGHVRRIGDLDIAIAAGNDPDRNLGKVAQHHAAVVGRGEPARPQVGVGQFIGVPDDRKPEALRCLAPGQVMAIRDRGHQPVGDLDDRVGGRDRHAERVALTQRDDTIGDHSLIQQRPGRVVKQHQAIPSRAVAVGGAGRGCAVGRPASGTEQGDGTPGRFWPVASALDDAAELAESAVKQRPRLVEMAGGHHHEDVIDLRRRVEGGHGVFQHWPTGQWQQLFRGLAAEPEARAAGEHYRDRAHIARLPGAPDA